MDRPARGRERHGLGRSHGFGQLDLVSHDAVVLQTLELGLFLALAAAALDSRENASLDRIEPDRDDEEFPGPGHHRSAGENERISVTVRFLRDQNGFSRQCRLVHFHVRPFQQDAVGCDDVAHGNSDHVAHDYLLWTDVQRPPVSDHGEVLVRFQFQLLPTKLLRLGRLDRRLEVQDDKHRQEYGHALDRRGQLVILLLASDQENAHRRAQQQRLDRVVLAPIQNQLAVAPELRRLDVVLPKLRLALRQVLASEALLGRTPQRRAQPFDAAIRSQEPALLVLHHVAQPILRQRVPRLARPDRSHLLLEAAFLATTN
mmetsp:Transcript_6985/g.21293  ORF Transcript_6985/g.21293 Transcript_6985/m.21293 type:complete len:316 (-) Transcript_6985:60-1007(-)